MKQGKTDYVNYIVNKKSMICVIAAVLFFTAAMFYSGADACVTVALDLLSIILIPLKITRSNAMDKYVPGISIIGASILLLLIVQASVGAGMKEIMFPVSIIEGFLICLLLTLLGVFILGSIWKGTAIAAIFLLLISTVDAYVFLLRGTELMIFDFISVPTGLNVIKDYTFPLIDDVVTSWYSALLLLILIYKINGNRKIVRKRYFCILMTTFFVIVMISHFAMRDIRSYRWSNQGSKFNGLLVNFMLQGKESAVMRPTGYNRMELEQSVEKKQDTIADDPPDIIVIMNESFADFREIGQCDTDKEFLSFWDSLDDNTVKGFCYASIFGGKTSCSEYEFLTGNTLAFLPNGCIPYQQYVRPNEFSMISELKKYGYECSAMHPYFSNGWNRINAYKNLGFDKIYYIDDFPQKDLIRGLVSDKELYQFLISKYKKRNHTQPFFTFAVTMQNHGGWDYEGYNSKVHFSGFLKNKGYDEEEQYLTLIRESDRAFKELIKYFSKEDNKVIVVMFGDHYPGFIKSFYDDLHGSDIDENDLNSYSLKLKIPFAIWTNYDIEEKSEIETSLNYLSNYIYDVAGFEPAYNCILNEISETIPIINAYGYYSKENKQFMSIEEADGRERDVINYYRCIQFNNIFDRNNHIKLFN